MKFYLKSLTLITLACTLTYSCQKEEVTSANPETIYKISNQIFQKIAKLGINPSNVVRETISKNDDSKESGYLAHDVYFSESDLKTMNDFICYRQSCTKTLSYNKYGQCTKQRV